MQGLRRSIAKVCRETSTKGAIPEGCPAYDESAVAALELKAALLEKRSASISLTARRVTQGLGIFVVVALPWFANSAAKISEPFKWVMESLIFSAVAFACLATS
eukprot:5537672-Prymnesium_polylepis.1